MEKTIIVLGLWYYHNKSQAEFCNRDDDAEEDDQDTEENITA